MNPIEFGIFDHIERRDESPNATYDGHLEVAARADALSYFCYHLAEHHGTGLSLAPSPSTFLAAVALRTTRIRLGPLVYLLPMHHPLRLAEEIAMLDNLSGGRFELGVGRGASPIELAFFGVDVDGSLAWFDEALDVLLTLLSDGRLDHRSDRYDLREVRLEIRTLQSPHPPVWYPSSGSGRLPWAAARGYHTVLNGTLEAVRQGGDLFREHAISMRQRVGITRYVVMGKTSADAHHLASSAYPVHLRNLLQLAHERGIPARSPAIPPTDLAEAERLGWAIVGDADEVAEKVVGTLDSTGCDYFVFPPLLGDLSVDHALWTLEEFDRAVIPTVRREIQAIPTDSA